MNLTPNTNVEAAKEFRAIFEVEQNGRKQTLVIGKDRVVVGTVESADIKLSGSGVAPIHALIELRLGTSEQLCEARIVDLASSTGVSINGKRALNEALRVGDLIQIGDAVIKFGFLKPDGERPLPDQALLLIDKSTVQPIFDYRPIGRDALEVVYSWNGVILDVKHFVHEESITLAPDQDHDFMIPGILSSAGAFTLATRTEKQWTLRLDPKMTGVLYLGGRIISVEEFRKTSSTSSVKLGSGDFVKIQIGALTFYLSQTVAPPVLLKQTRFITDPFFAKTALISVGITLLTLIGVSQVQLKNEEAPQVTETVAKILYHPEKYSVKRPLNPPEKKEVPKVEAEPEKVKKAEIDFTKPQDKTGKLAQTKSPQPGKKQAGQNQAKEGAGARAKGAEGSRGSKNAKASNSKQSAANRPSPEAGQGRGGTVSQVADNGNVQLLKGATNKILDLFGGSGQKLGKSGSKLQGFGGFSTQGSGGAALQGQGKGGGGNADTLLGGTSDHGRGGGKVGTGLGAEGTGAGIVGGKTRIDLNVGGGDETVVIGSIDRDAIDAAIRAHRDEFRYCYEREVNAGHPNLAGKIVSAFVIGGSGRASQMAVASSSMGSPSVEGCVLKVIGRIQFPQPAGGVPVTIKYPFAFTNASK